MSMESGTQRSISFSVPDLLLDGGAVRRGRCPLHRYVGLLGKEKSDKKWRDSKEKLRIKAKVNKIQA